MGLGESIVANAVGGLIVATAVAALGVYIAKRFTQRWEDAQARRERDLAAAAELYGVYGKLFAGWKVWNDHLKADDPPGMALLPRLELPEANRRSELLAAAAEAEGGFEALVIRITLEHDLDSNQRAALWSLRSAFKQLRKAIVAGEPLVWWRSDIHEGTAGHDGYRAYRAVKMLTASVAALLLTGPDIPTVSTERRREALRHVTGSGAEFTHDARIALAIEQERQLRTKEPQRKQDHWEWITVAEQILGPAAQD